MAWNEKYVSVAGAGAHNGTSEANAWTLAEAVAAVAADDRVNVIKGTYTLAADLTFATAGTTTQPIWWRGYSTVIGDLDSAGGSRVGNTNLPLIDADTNTDQIIISGAHQIFSNIAITSICQDAGGAVNCTGGNIRLIRCSIINTGANSAARALSVATAGSVQAIGCYLKATTTAATAVLNSQVFVMHGGVIFGGIIGLNAQAQTTVSKAIIYGFTTSGVKTESAANVVRLSDCSLFGDKDTRATNGVLVTTIPTSGQVVLDNCIVGFATNGVNAASATNGVTVINTHFYDCTNNLVNLAQNADVTTAGELGTALFNFDNDTDPWVAKATGNFSLAAGNTADKGTAYPGAFEAAAAAALCTGTPDIGAVQSAAAGGGSSSFAFVS